jgi:tetratricopeptide (TPR) repeat protein
VLLAGACSTKKNTFTRRAYHNLSAHYNAWWNGNESLKEGVYQIGKSAKDNYISVLPVYNYGSQTVAQSVNPNMDRAIEKASKVIQKHSMFFNNKEYVKWVMNSYLMIGKANFYKQDYGAAKRAFEFVTTKYSYDPIRYEAQLWIAKTLQKQKQYEAALNVLNELTAESETILLPWKVRKALPMTYADIYIAQGKLALAREQIEAGLPLQSGSKFKTRLNFILGQIYQQEGKNSQATEYYTLAIKGTPSFEMAFNARINMARVYDAGRSDHRLIVRELEKMLKDAKNRDFQDQIYFALADIALKEKNDTLGISHLRKSVATSLDNDFQKSTSALKLADLYFNRQQYTFAGLYYDTAVNYLPKEFPDYENISKKTEIIGRLVKNLEIVQVQDSLQALAGMPQAERFAIIDKAIARYIEREEEIARKAEEEKMALEAGIALGGRRVTDMEGQTTVGGGGWYFYNPSAIGMGYSEFTRKWGRRRLEDNWRLSNKRVVDFDMIAENGEIADSLDIEGGEKASVTDLRSREAYLVNLPLTPEKVDASNVQIGQALFNAGLIYLEELNNVSEAEKTLNTLLTRFPSDTNALQAHYHLYRINRDLGNDGSSKSDYSGLS